MSKIHPITHPVTPTTKAPAPTQVDDMEKFHRLATSGALSDLMLKLGGGKRK